MVLRYCESTFKESYIMTIGSNFSTKSIELPDFPNYNVKLQIWDLAGQKHFSFVRPPFYRGCAATIMTFDLTRRSSFANLHDWKEEVEKVVGSKPTILVGNKLDLAVDGIREVGTKEGEAFKDEIGAIAYYEGSAKLGDKIETIFTEITIAILKATAKI